MTRQEAKIESKQTEIQSLHRDLQSTQDSLNNWDEVNLNSVEGVYVDDRDGTSISSESRVAGPAISHFPKGGGDPELLPQRARSMPKAAQTKTATPSTQPASNSKASLAVPNSSVPTASSPIEITAPTITVLDFGGPKQTEAEHIFCVQMASTGRTEFRIRKISFKWISEVEDTKSIDDLKTLENLDFEVAYGQADCLDDPRHPQNEWRQ